METEKQEDRNKEMKTKEEGIHIQNRESEGGRTNGKRKDVEEREE